ncbi:hypothetical protein Busp01_56040 [Trinickia caryophylli]|uniref:Uncharacterized protein n=1 Tax=Trinickia caryophylli TaxID=28094 RepID=A0A1X7H890_TRICW|nr:hypothetical protein Busp01_56040 [Trinickia caryophylli]SMF81513.1 Protein of unknown function [Trinickia caryophylli]
MCAGSKPCAAPVSWSEKAEGVWRVPGDLAERGRQYDAQRLGGGVALELKSHLPIERQVHVIGATWLDQQLIAGGKELGNLGFGAEVQNALSERADFLAGQGLAERRGQRVDLARNLLATLRGREVAQAAKDIAIETGLGHRPVADGQRMAGIYRRSVMHASGRHAMLDDGNTDFRSCRGSHYSSSGWDSSWLRLCVAACLGNRVGSAALPLGNRFSCCQALSLALSSESLLHVSACAEFVCWAIGPMRRLFASGAQSRIACHWVSGRGTGVAAALAPLDLRFELDTFGSRLTDASLGLIAFVLASVVVPSFTRSTRAAASCRPEWNVFKPSALADAS